MSAPLLSTPNPQTYRRRFTLNDAIARLEYRLAPLYPLPSGSPHPQFPATMLHFHLLTEPMLDSLALYYHQIQHTSIAISGLPSLPYHSSPYPAGPSIWTHAYPACMEYDVEFLEHLGSQKGDAVRIAAKRRKFGRFIGLRGCETPVDEREFARLWREALERRGLEKGVRGRGEGGWW